SLMTELYHHIGRHVDVPAGDIGVGSREVSYLFGQHKRLTNEFTGVLTGKGLSHGGSAIRTEATGYGCAFFVEEMLQHRDESLEGKTCIVSGSGNVAQYTVEKVNALGGKVVTLSDSGGFILDPDGIDDEKLQWVVDLKTERRGRISEYAKEFGCEFHEGKAPWGVECDVAFPSATQNELEIEDAKELVKNGIQAIGEGANMPCTREAMKHFVENKVLFGPSKAANAGGVAVSGLEQSQNALRLSWTPEEVEDRLRDIMRKIHKKCLEHGESGDYVNYVDGANIAGFKKVADAILAYGVV
ncbi:MAG: glutamate dehydrogenase, partial [Planctomycetota bacterium]